MNESIVIYEGPDACRRCLGWKRIADSQEGESWKYWAELTPPENIAVTLGVVRPVVCPRCGGTGKEPPAQPTASTQPAAGLNAIRERWEGVEWHYGEEQNKRYVTNAFLITAGGRAIDLRFPTELERKVLSRVASAPADVQTLLAELAAARADAAALRRAARNVLRAEAGEWDTMLLADTYDHMMAELVDVLEADSPGATLLAEIDRLRAGAATEADEIKALLIQMRRYFISHNLMTGECVAWTELKARFGVGQRDEEDEAWMAEHTGEPFQLRRSSDERPRRRGE
jgi:hypothetical protein